MKSVDPFSTGHFYHVYNKSMDLFSPFSNSAYAQHFINLTWYYRSYHCRVSYSCYQNSPEDLKHQFRREIMNSIYFKVEILAYCIMPTHYHFLLKQNRKAGIYKFMNNISNAFTRFYNLLNERKGPIFIPRYRSKIIQTEEQLIHVSRYIHLNPYSSKIVNSVNELFNYRFSSLKEYLYRQTFVNTSFILNNGYFLKNRNKYRFFITNRAEYQKTLEYIKHIKKWG